MANNDFRSLPRVVVPFALLEPNRDNPGLKDFTPAVVPADTPDQEESETECAPVLRGEFPKVGEEGDDSDPKVSSVPGSAVSSLTNSVTDAPSEPEEAPAAAEKVSSTKTVKVTPQKP